jgi:PAS domain S-box-containing protein
MNPAAEDLTGFTIEELHARGVGLHELVHHSRPDGSKYPVSECPIHQAFPSQTRAQGEEVFIHRDGHFYEVGFSASPIREVSGEVVGTIIEVRNITKRKAIEQALLEADRRKDEFIATLAHELRNPLAPISNLLAAIKGAETNAELVRDARATIERQVAKMVRLVDDLLDVSRISRNTIELKKQPVELRAAFDDVLVVCSPIIEQHGHSLDLKIPQEPIYVNADAARISQVLCNLVNNACKFTPNGGRITVTAELRDDDVYIVVKDSGVGIPRDQIDRIFEMFAQVRGPLSDARGGLGIGLALAKRLIEMHGGSIAVRSDGEWMGTEFTVRMPVMKNVPAESPRAETQAELPAGRRVLVVDDNFDSAESMAMLLTMSGNKCAMAHDGGSAIKLAEEFLPEVILLDIGLPEMDGYEVCEKIRQQPWGETVQIIAMTGWGQAEDRQRSKAAGFNDHLVKPIEIAKLSRVMNGAQRDEPTNKESSY